MDVVVSVAASVVSFVEGSVEASVVMDEFWGGPQTFGSFHQDSDSFAVVVEEFCEKPQILGLLHQELVLFIAAVVVEGP